MDDTLLKSYDDIWQLRLPSKINTVTKNRNILKIAITSTLFTGMSNIVNCMLMEIYIVGISVKIVMLPFLPCFANMQIKPDLIEILRYYLTKLSQTQTGSKNY